MEEAGPQTILRLSEDPFLGPMVSSRPWDEEETTPGPSLEQKVPPESPAPPVTQSITDEVGRRDGRPYDRHDSSL